VTRARRETSGDLALLAAGGLLLASLFLVWSHQLSTSALARYSATGAFAGVPRSPTGWQVYSAADVVLALVAAALVAAALRGGRGGRWLLAAVLAIALAFVVHAEVTPPTNGTNVFDPSATPPAYVHDAATPGPGEALALVALVLGAAGLLLSFSAD
jgi:hypothetical protein